jgi:hypothetical protein
MTKCLLILLLVISCETVVASIGSVTESKGSSVIERDKDILDVSIDLNVQSMDTVATENGRVRIDFIDDTRVDVTENSRLVIDEFVYDTKQKTGSLSLKASLGTIRYASGQIAKNSKQNVTVSTPSATIGIRGTDFAMIVDEIGGSMITLLPSCDTSGMCVVGEIVVESDVGQVIMNQAFQTTMVSSSGTPPSPPIVLELSESDMNNMLIIRKAKPADEDGSYARETKKKKFADLMGIDFLDFDVLESNPLDDTIEMIWKTELDNTQFYLGELLVDIMEQINRALAALLRNEFSKQEFLLSFEDEGFNSETGTSLEIDGGFWILERYDYGNGQYYKLKLSTQGGYTIDFLQGDFEYYDYRLGDGSSSIFIDQRVD